MGVVTLGVSLSAITASDGGGKKEKRKLKHNEVGRVMMMSGNSHAL